jgi:hypothetical protein
VVVRGKKRFRIYSPNDAPFLHTHGGIKVVHKNGLISYDEEICSDGHYSDEYTNNIEKKSKEKI